jgi:hypothetical protein
MALWRFSIHGLLLKTHDTNRCSDCLSLLYCTRRLNNNTLSGAFPASSANLSHLVFLWVLLLLCDCVLCWINVAHCGTSISGICPIITWAVQFQGLWRGHSSKASAPCHSAFDQSTISGGNIFTIETLNLFSCSIVGNPLICGAAKEQDCYGTLPMPMSYSLNNTQGMPSYSTMCIADRFCHELVYKSSKTNVVLTSVFCQRYSNSSEI